VINPRSIPGAKPDRHAQATAEHATGRERYCELHAHTCVGMAPVTRGPQAHPTNCKIPGKKTYGRGSESEPFLTVGAQPLGEK